MDGLGSSFLRLFCGVICGKYVNRENGKPRSDYIDFKTKEIIQLILNNKWSNWNSHKIQTKGQDLLLSEQHIILFFNMTGDELRSRLCLSYRYINKYGVRSILYDDSRM